MKKLLSLLLATIIILSAAAALADPVKINGLEKRDIKINEAGLNPSADEMIAQGISPTTGRQLDSIPYVDGFAGTAYKLEYQPIMVQISNAGGGINIDSKGRPATAPVNLHYADVVYEACQANSANGGSLTRFSAVFSDTVPDYVGFVRSTRATHPRLRQEWDCALDACGAAPYTFLGTADYVSHTGSRPMNIVWQLHQEIPAKFLRKTQQVMG